MLFFHADHIAKGEEGLVRVEKTEHHEHHAYPSHPVGEAPGEEEGSWQLIDVFEKRHARRSAGGYRLEEAVEHLAGKVSLENPQVDVRDRVNQGNEHVKEYQTCRGLPYVQSFPLPQGVSG